MEINRSIWNDIGRITGGAAIAAVCAYMYSMFRPSRRGPELPPMPYSFPAVGNLPSLFRDRQGLHHFVLQIRRTFGDVFRIKLGVHEIVFIFGHKNVQEVAMAAVDRPDWICTPHRVIKEKGIVWNSGNVWRGLRSLFKAAQEDIHIVAALQSYFTTEYEVFQRHVMAKPSTHDRDLEFLITQFSFNFLSAFLLGKRYSYDDPDMIEIRDRLTELGATTATANVENFLPILGKFRWSKFRTADNNKTFLFDRFREIIKEKPNSSDDPPTDFLQFYISQSKKEMTGGITEIDLLQAVVDMFLAGKDNLLLTTKWILMALVKYPDVQSKCRSEIQQVVGQGQRVQSQERSRTPYTSATIKEILRMYSPVPFTVFHCSDRDIKVGKYDIPKKTLMMIECKAPCNDKKLWTEPDVFNPDRFLNVDEDQHLPEGCFIPYGPGPRYCIGKYVAEIFLYNFVAHVLQNFEVTTTTPDTELSFSNVYQKFGLKPDHFDEVVLKPL